MASFLASAGFGGLASGVLGGIGSIFTNNANAANARSANEFNAEMSNTAHQREVTDLKAAGLNPVLSVNGGASAPMAVVPPVQDTVGKAANSAISGLAISQNLKNLEAQGDLLKNQSKKTVIDAATSMINGKGLMLDNTIKALTIPGIANTADVDKSTVGKALSYVDRISKSIGSGAAAVNSVKSVTNPPYQPLNTFNPKTGEVFK